MNRELVNQELENRFNDYPVVFKNYKASKFVRLSDGTIINLDELAAVRRPDCGCLAVIILKNGVQIESDLLPREVWDEINGGLIG